MNTIIWDGRALTPGQFKAIYAGFLKSLGTFAYPYSEDEVKKMLVGSPSKTEPDVLHLRALVYGYLLRELT